MLLNVEIKCKNKRKPRITKVTTETHPQAPKGRKTSLVSREGFSESLSLIRIDARDPTNQIGFKTWLPRIVGSRRGPEEELLQDININRFCETAGL